MTTIQTKCFTFDLMLGSIPHGPAVAKTKAVVLEESKHNYSSNQLQSPDLQRVGVYDLIQNISIKLAKQIKATIPVVVAIAVILASL